MTLRFASIRLSLARVTSLIKYTLTCVIRLHRGSPRRPSRRKQRTSSLPASVSRSWAGKRSGCKPEKRPTTQGPPARPHGLVSKTPGRPALSSSFPASSGSLHGFPGLRCRGEVAVGSGKTQSGSRLSAVDLKAFNFEIHLCMYRGCAFESARSCCS